MAQLAARQIVALEVLGSKPSCVKQYSLLLAAQLLLKINKVSRCTLDYFLHFCTILLFGCGSLAICTKTQADLSKMPGATVEYIIKQRLPQCVIMLLSLVFQFRRSGVSTGTVCSFRYQIG